MKLKRILLEELIRLMSIYTIIFFFGLYIFSPKTEHDSKWLFLGSGIFSFAVFCILVFIRLFTGKSLNATSPKHFKLIMFLGVVIIIGMFLLRAFSLSTTDSTGFIFSIIMTILGFIIAILLMRENYSKDS